VAVPNWSVPIRGELLISAVRSRSERQKRGGEDGSSARWFSDEAALLVNGDVVLLIGDGEGDEDGMSRER
jgi:hypothetical protein